MGLSPCHFLVGIITPRPKTGAVVQPNYHDIWLHSADGYGQKASTKQLPFYMPFPLSAASDAEYNPDGMVDIKDQLTRNISGS